ncbi:MAG: hypothetical protein JO104_00940 [Candidatus Eremiobacteraeota bacterium]|nr:hypothetical protein [Candidatus Eremiobacteraeota bacterium]
MVLASTIPNAARAVDTIPFTDVKGGLIEVQGSVDGAPAVPMLVDLGAGVDVLSAPVGRRYVLVNGKYVTLRLSGERVDLPIGKVLTLTVGSVRLDAPHVGIWNGLSGMGVDGLISATAFRNITTTFDFRNHAIVIEDAQTFPERIRTAVRVPLILQDDLGIALGLFARFDFGDGKTGLCEIDTGSQGITIDKTFGASIGLNPSAAGKAAIASIALVGAPQTRIEQPSATFADLIYDCNVGNSFWAGRSFTLDLPNRYIYVTTSV